MSYADDLLATETMEQARAVIERRRESLPLRPRRPIPL
jgi:hypothetical protein